MNEMKEAVGNWREAKQFSPADENDFLRWLDKADTEEKLFSRLTFWFTFRGLPADQNQRYHLVQERARELRLWNGLELKLRRWQDRVADEYEQIGKEAFAARIGEDYADYINSLTDPEAAPQQAAPEPETAKPAGVQAWSARELSEMVLPPIVKTLRVLLQQGDGTWSGNAQALMQMGERYTNEALASSTRALAGRIKELQPMLWERDAIKCWDKQNGTGGKRYCFKMNRIDNTVPVMDSTQLSLRHNYR